MLILVIESSTTSAKAMLFNTETKTYEVKAQPYTLSYDDISMQDADCIFKETIDLARMLCKDKKVDIISLSGTWHSVMLCDKNMKPQTPVYQWSYTGASKLCKELRKDKQYVNEFYQKTGCMVNGIYPIFKLMHLKGEGHQLNNYYIAGQGTYNMFRLTGERVTMDSMASGTGLMNIHSKKYDKDILAELGIKESQLSRIVSYKDTFPLSKEGGILLGMDEGIPVVPTGPDGGLNQVGAGALGEGVMTFSVGTSGAMRLTTQKPIIPKEPSTWCYLSPKDWLSGAATSGCCNCIDWYKNRMFSTEISYEDIEKEFTNTKDTPVFLPFLFGERCPGWQDDRMGSFFDIKPNHSVYDFYQGIMEGVLFNLYQCYEELTKINGTPRKIKLSGGILHSNYWTQMCVDIFKMEMEVDDIKHSSLLGGVALGLDILGLENITEYPSNKSKIFYPDPTKFDLYTQKYERYKYWYTKTS